MKIGIVTVYDGVSNVGSYLQAYAMQIALEKLGHEAFFVEKKTVPARIWEHIAHINPKRAFFLRLKSGWNYLLASSKFRFIKPEQTEEKLDILLFGSDEIWNMDNPFFKDPLFFGVEQGLPKVAYAVSVGAMAHSTLEDNRHIASGAGNFSAVLVRDERTRQMMESYVKTAMPLVCDPTFLVGKEALQVPAKMPKEKYILIYSYGLDQLMVDHICRFAQEKRLKIVSAHFWHIFCDEIIPCKPLEFGSLMAGAEYVFTSTFHGAVFAMMNHTRCAILPVREKVAYVAGQMGQKNRLIDAAVPYEVFRETIEMPFDTAEFEARLGQLRAFSWEKLEEALQC